MIRSTQIARVGDGLMLCASVDDEQSESSLAEVKSQIKLILRRLNRNSEAQASIESGNYTLQYGLGTSGAFTLPYSRQDRLGMQASQTRQDKANSAVSNQLPNGTRDRIPMRMRPVLSAEASLHLPLRPSRRVQHVVLPGAAAQRGPAAVRLHGVRHVHRAHQGHVRRHARGAEPRQAQRRAARRHKGHDPQHRGPALPRRQPRAHGRDELPPPRRQQEVPQGRRQDQLGPAHQAVRPHRRLRPHRAAVCLVPVLLAFCGAEVDIVSGRVKGGTRWPVIRRFWSDGIRTGARYLV